MSEPKVPSPPPPSDSPARHGHRHGHHHHSRRSLRRRLKALLPALKWLGVGLAVLLVILYFVGTSSAFVKAVILPRVGQALQANITASSVSFSPWHRLVLRDLQLQTTGSEPLLQVKEARVHYSLIALLRGHLKISEVTLVSPLLRIFEYGDGTGNLRALRASLESQRGPRTLRRAFSGSEQLSLRRIRLDQAGICWTRHEKDGRQSIRDLTQLNLTLDQLQNGQPGKLVFSADLGYETYPAGVAAPGNRLQAKLTGSYDYDLDARLLPRTLHGGMRMDIAQAQGNLRDLASVRVAQDCVLNPGELQQLNVRIERAGQELGMLKMSGPLDLAKSEGRLKLELMPLDKRVLNLFGLTRGWDFDQSTLSANTRIDLTQGGNLIDIQSSFVGHQISIRQSSEPIPPTDVTFDCLVNVRRSDQVAVLQKLNLAAQQLQTEVLRAGVNRPMTISWGSQPGGLRESFFSLNITNLQLADWKCLLDHRLLKGNLALQLSVQVDKDGRQFKMSECKSVIADLGVQLGTNRIDIDRLKLEANGQWENFDVLSLGKFDVEAIDRNRPMLKAAGSVRHILSSKETHYQIDLKDMSLPEVLQHYPIPDLSVVAGNVNLSSIFVQDQQGRQFRSSLVLDSFTGQYKNLHFQNHQCTADTDLEIQGSQLMVKQARLTLRQGVESGGSWECSGNYYLNQQKGQFAFSTLKLNQYALSPLFNPVLAPCRLSSLSVDSSGTAEIDLHGNSVFKAKGTIANLLVEDPAQRLPTTPVTTQFQIDALLYQLQLLTLRQADLSFPYGMESGGTGEFTGRYDLGTKAAQVAFKLTEVKQYLLGPYLDPWLAPRTLASISINADGNVSYDPSGNTSLQADLSVTNLVFGKTPPKLTPVPLGAQIHLSGVAQRRLFDLRKLDVDWTPTTRGKNQAQIRGRWDLSPANPTPGALTLQAESLDVTPFYELFHRQTNGLATAGLPAAARPGESEPRPPRLPLPHFVCDLSVGQLYIGPGALTNWHTRVQFDPMKGSFNPVNSP